MGCFLGLFGDAYGQLSLHTRMAAHREDTGAGLADVATQEQKVTQHLDCEYAEREAHATTGDHSVRIGDKADQTQMMPKRGALLS